MRKLLAAIAASSMFTALAHAQDRPGKTVEVVGNSPAEFAAFEKTEYARWKNVIETGKITAD